MEKNDSLDKMCTSVSMLHSLLKHISLISSYEDFPTSMRVATEANIDRIIIEQSLNEEQSTALKSASVCALTLV